MSKYDSIINYDYKMFHPRMSIENRSAQFAPFSALTGFSDLIKEEEKIKVPKKEILDETKEILDSKLKLIRYNLKKRPIIKITYYENNDYKEIEEVIKKIDFYHHYLILENNIKIKIDDISNLDSQDINFFDII